jgi:hypothetical protein
MQILVTVQHWIPMPLGNSRLPFLALVGYVQLGIVFVLLLLLIRPTQSQDIE